MLSAQLMYKALIERDESFEGSFIAGVKTTGIFCRPTCRARKPKPENVEFFQNTHEAILKGYRPCKVCKPLENLGRTPSEFKILMDELHQNPNIKFKDWDLKNRGIDPNTIRRWFLKNHGITFHAYQRMNRINSAFLKVQTGAPLTMVAYDSGFESLSGFNDSFKSIFGVSPSKSRQQMIINIVRIETPLGTMIAGATHQGVCLLEFSDRKMLETELKTLAVKLNAILIQAENKHFEPLRSQLTEYFNGFRREFDIPLHTAGTDFQLKVWNELQKIPFGTTRSYKSQALSLGQASAVRAVANANGMNRISILIPCHRVIGEDGSLTGYGGGLNRKKWLLEFEKRNLVNL